VGETAGATLVTGSAGFIGSHLVEALLSEGRRVVGLDDFNDYYDPGIKRWNIRGATASPAYQLIEGDIRDPAVVGRVFDMGPFDAVIHLAARAGVRPSLKDPLLYDSVNVSGTTALLEATRRNPSTHFVFGSSSSVYGSECPVPFSESVAADRPSSPYAATKRAGELTAYAYHHLYGIPVTCLRFFTVYGPRQRPDMAIHKFARLIEEGLPVEIFGDGNSRRDYTYVDDIVRGVVQAARTPAGYRIYNLGTTATTALSELIDLLATCLGKPARVVGLPEQPGDVPITFADISRARQDLGYQPATPLAEGISRFVAWLRERQAAG
jgi:UDP-glucuronate 4-epimerase